MRILKLLPIMAICLGMLASCEKIEDVTVTLKQSGNLSIQLVDTTNQPIAGYKVKLYTNMVYYLDNSQRISTTPYDTKVTNSSGLADFGELNTGTYMIAIEKVKVGGQVYNVTRSVQVISGSDASIVVKPQEFVGKLTLNVLMQSSQISSVREKVKNANVILIKYQDYSDSLSFDDIQKLKVVKGVTDSNGKVVFDKLPAYFEYRPYVYLNDASGSWPIETYSSLYVSKDDERETSVVVDKISLMNLKPTLDLTINYYGYDSNMDYGYHPVKNTNVIFVKDNDYYSFNLSWASLSTVRSYKVAEGITNSGGNIKITFPKLGTYKALVYYSDTKKTWSSSFNIYDFENFRTIEVEENDLGLK